MQNQTENQVARKSISRGRKIAHAPDCITISKPSLSPGSSKFTHLCHLSCTCTGRLRRPPAGLEFNDTLVGTIHDITVENVHAQRVYGHRDNWTATIEGQPLASLLDFLLRASFPRSSVLLLCASSLPCEPGLPLPTLPWAQTHPHANTVPPARGRSGIVI